MKSENASRERWSLDDIPLERVDVERVRQSEELFLLLAGASFVETGSDLYTRNLVEQFRGDAEVSAWLADHWEPEELRHGHALRAYVNHVWPEFDWEAAFADFISDYSSGCTAGELEPTRCLEMAARCVVEMGTATYYRTIQAVADEPVLKRLVGLVQQDEVRHYKHFFRYFSKYNDIEQRNRVAVLGAVVRRLREIVRSDVDCGLWYPYRARHGGASRDGREFRRGVARAATLLRRHYPTAMAIRMLAKPLALPPAVTRLGVAPAKLAQRMLWR